MSDFHKKSNVIYALIENYFLEVCMLTKPLRVSSFLAKKICDQHIDNLSIVHEKKVSFFKKISNVENGKTTFCFNKKKASFENKKLFSSIDKSIESIDKEKWFKEEKISLLSSEVNKVIDSAANKYGDFINKNDKRNIFDKISSTFTVTLDQKCTQSSISHILYNDKTLSARVEKLYHPSQSRDEKNKLKNVVNSKLTDIVFMRKFGGINLDLVRIKTAEEIALLMKLKKPTGASN